MRVGRALVSALALGLLAPWTHPVTADNTVSVVSAAAAAGTNFGLRLTLEPSSTNMAYVLAGPANGFNDETHLAGSFYIKPLGMTMSSTVGQNYFQMMDFLERVAMNSAVKLIFFLHQHPNGNDLYITVWHWNDHAHSGAGGWVFTGNGLIAQRSAPHVYAQVLVEYDWTAGDPGNLKMWRTPIASTGVVGARTLLFDRPVPGQANAKINYVFAGYFAAKSAGTHGVLDLDEFVFNR